MIKLICSKNKTVNVRHQSQQNTLPTAVRHISVQSISIKNKKHWSCPGLADRAEYCSFSSPRYLYFKGTIMEFKILKVHIFPHIQLQQSPDV